MLTQRPADVTMRRLLGLYRAPMAAAVLIALTAVWGVAGGLAASRPATGVLVLGATVAVASTLPLIARRVAGPQNWFHPLLMPVAYMAFVLLAPLLYVSATQRTVGGVGAEALSLTLVATMALTVVGFVAGILAALRCVSPPTGSGVEPQWDRVLLWGRAMLLLAVVMRAYSTARAWGAPYGSGSVDFGTSGLMQTATDFLSVTGPALIVLAQLRLRAAVGSPLDLVLFGVFCIITLVAGSRGELLAPIVFALWLYHRDVRRIPLRAIASGCVVVVVLFQAIQGVRGGDSPVSSPRATIERTLTAVGVPMHVTSLTIANVPARADHRLGDTYVESVKRQLPGVIAVKLWGEPADTGTFVLRRIIGFNSSDAGLGFALPAESYLNFGVSGSLVIALLVGLLFGYAYQKQVGVLPSRARHVLYGFLIASLPLSLRADAVLQIKAVLYPMVAVAIVLALSRERSSEAFGFPGLNLKRPRLIGRRTT